MPLYELSEVRGRFVRVSEDVERVQIHASWHEVERAFGIASLDLDNAKFLNLGISTDKGQADWLVRDEVSNTDVNPRSFINFQSGEQSGKVHAIWSQPNEP